MKNPGPGVLICVASTVAAAPAANSRKCILNAGGATPFGYKRDLQGGLLIDQIESVIVRQVVDIRAAGLSLRTIATTLNEAGLMPRRGAKFYPSTVRYMLDNPKYRGWDEYFFRHDGELHCLTQGTHPAFLVEAA